MSNKLSRPTAEDGREKDKHVSIFGREKLEKNFKLWVDEIEDMEEVQAADQDGLDLYSFYEELCTLRSEFRKSARRSHDSFSRFAETLSSFDEMIKSLRNGLSEETHSREQADYIAKKKIYLPLIGIFERFRHLAERMNHKPKTGFFSAGKRWSEAWSTLQDGINIVKSHFEDLLKREGITVIETTGKAFDPYLMTAVDVRKTDSFEPNIVAEETSSGYLYQGNVMKLAEVIITKKEDID